MIKFFRNIRQAMIHQNRVSKYLFYAIGEIILVVIGILIALQINNWNEERKLRIESQEILNRLGKEIRSNQDLLEIHKEYQARVTSNLEELIQLMGPESKTVDTSRLPELLTSLYFVPKYNPELGTLNSLNSSGKMAILQSDELKAKLNSLPGLLQHYNYLQNLLYDISKSQIINYMSKEFPFRHLEVVQNRRIGSSKFTVDYDGILNSMELESYAELKRIDSYAAYETLEEIYKLQEEILMIIEPELHD